MMPLALQCLDVTSCHPAYHAGAWFLKRMSHAGAERERLATAYARHMGLAAYVPPVWTMPALGHPGRAYVVSRWQDELRATTAASLRAIPAADQLRMLLVAYLLGDTDRHAGNYAVVGSRAVAIDWGFAFASDTTFGPAPLAHLLDVSYGTRARRREASIHTTMLGDILARADGLTTAVARLAPDEDGAPDVPALRRRLAVMRMLAARERATLADVEAIAA